MALSTLHPWHYFDGDDQADALTALRARMGETYSASPDDAQLLLVLERSVAYLHRATDRFFVKRTGQISMPGNDAPRLALPHPVVSSDQGGTGITEIVIGDDDQAVDETAYAVNDGAMPGPDDPRDHPFVEWVPYDSVATSRPPMAEGAAARWPYGVNNIHVTGSWGYLEEDGSTPELVLHVLARLCVLNVIDNDDLDGIEDRRRAAILTEQTQGRSYTIDRRAVSGGLTLDREIDKILASYRRPPRAKVSRGRRRRSRSRYYR